MYHTWAHHTSANQAKVIAQGIAPLICTAQHRRWCLVGSCFDFLSDSGSSLVGFQYRTTRFLELSKRIYALRACLHSLTPRFLKYVVRLTGFLNSLICCCDSFGDAICSSLTASKLRVAMLCDKHGALHTDSSCEVRHTILNDTATVPFWSELAELLWAATAVGFVS